MTERLPSIQHAKQSWTPQQELKTISLMGRLVEVAVARGKRTGQVYAKGILEDITGSIDLIVFPQAYARLGDHFKAGNAVEVSGVLKGEERAVPKLVVESLSTI